MAITKEKAKKCPKCKGTGNDFIYPCWPCKGTGFIKNVRANVKKRTYTESANIQSIVQPLMGQNTSQTSDKGLK